MTLTMIALHVYAAYTKACGEQRSILRRALVSLKLADETDEPNENRYYLGDAHAQIRAAAAQERRFMSMLNPQAMSL